ncbi:MAG TPA: 50S ribosomal protein L11 methyltransferase [Chitinophagaceae bacterium]|jgi:ribosomal protein L11 methyltransferase|nr:50S ribosomal protein L11 methyltransferase [Chitinophagaceae bacterium]
MADYIKIEFGHLNTEQKDIVIALLTEMNYEGFEEEDNLLKAFIQFGIYDEKELKAFCEARGLSFSVSKLEDKNWNSHWESNFQPVIINRSGDDASWVAIRAAFHPPIRDVKHELIITPKMSFGTGHHATTSMMMKMMSELNFAGKTVLDFGTGTGILAILSEKLGAARVIAIDNDDQSIKNSSENFDSNSCSKIQLLEASTANVDIKFDIILANIIKGVILDNLTAFTKQTVNGGVVLLSGLLADDEEEILEKATGSNLILDKKIEDKNWICLQLTYKSTGFQR